MTLVPGTYKLHVRDASGRYPDMYYDGATTLSSATPIVVPATGAPAPVTITVSPPVSRRRTVTH